MKKAFTLAEVLITLTIVGVIAALTIPNLLHEINDHIRVQETKKVYALLANAYTNMVAENGELDTWEWRQSDIETRNKLFMENFLPYLKVQKDWKNDSSYFPFSQYKSKIGFLWYVSNSGNTRASVVLSNNAIFNVYAVAPACVRGRGGGSCVELMVDVNGTKKPNGVGEDMFMFLGTKNKLVPYSNKTKCQYNNYAYENGLACAWWIMKYGNMDYKYRDVSAEW